MGLFKWLCGPKLSEDGIPYLPNSPYSIHMLHLSDKEYEAIYKAMKKGKSDKWLYERMPYLYKNHFNRVRADVERENDAESVLAELDKKK